MRNTPIERKLIDETIADFHITDFAKATIREVKAIAANAEAASGVEFIKMEMGVPGLPPSAVGVKAEVEALQNGIASLYPDINGLPALKEEAARNSPYSVPQKVGKALGTVCSSLGGSPWQSRRGLPTQ